MNLASSLLNRKSIFALLAVMPVVADIVLTALLRTSFWFPLVPGLYYACIVIVGLDFGWKAGLGLAVFAGGAHAVISELFLPDAVTALGPQALAFLVVGFALLEQRKQRESNLVRMTSLPQGSRPAEYLDQVSTMSSEILRQIRTPFASIEGAAFLVGQDSTPASKREEFVGIIVNECKRVDDILSELKESAEIVPLACRPIDASSILGEVIRLAAMEQPDPSISLRLEVSGDLPPLWCDPMRVQQAIVPFVISEMKGMQAGGEILLAADRQNGYGRIQLRVLGQTVRGSDPAAGRGSYSSTFDAYGGVRILGARRTALQHGGAITLDQTGHITKLLSLTLPLYNGQNP
jgi:signal transduction histidine kinase